MFLMNLTFATAAKSRTFGLVNLMFYANSLIFSPSERRNIKVMEIDWYMNYLQIRIYDPNIWRWYNFLRKKLILNEGRISCYNNVIFRKPQTKQWNGNQEPFETDYTISFGHKTWYSFYLFTKKIRIRSSDKLCKFVLVRTTKVKEVIRFAPKMLES